MAEQDHGHDDESLPAPGTPQDHQVAASKVHPRPANRLRVGIAIAAIGLVAVINTVGNWIGLTLANDHSDAAFNKAQHNTAQVHFLVTHQGELICNALIKSERNAIAGKTPGEPKPTAIQKQGFNGFLVSLGCKVPADLKA